jgi:DNA-binding transcriptional MerR regulator
VRTFYIAGMPLEDDDLLKPSEVATILGIGAHRLRFLRREGAIGYAPGPEGIYRYRAGDVLALRDKRGAEARR